MSILKSIGNTPIVQISNIILKLEMLNPSGSIKDRVALKMLQPMKDANPVVTEATTGNTGISVAMVSSVYGIESHIFVPHNTQRQKIYAIESYGANLHFCNTMFHGILLARDMVKHGQADVYLNQFNSAYNIMAQTEMAHEIRDQLRNTEKKTAIVAGVGTGGTIRGLHQVFPNADVYVVQSRNGAIIEGISDGVPTPLIPYGMRRTEIHISIEEAQRAVRYLASRYGLFCGHSGGANFYASHMIRKKYELIITILPDRGDRYIKHINNRCPHCNK